MSKNKYKNFKRLKKIPSTPVSSDEGVLDGVVRRLLPGVVSCPVFVMITVSALPK